MRALFVARSSIAAASAVSAAPRARKCPPFLFWRRLAVPATLCMCSVSPVRVGVAAPSARAPSGVACQASLLGPASDLRASAAVAATTPSAPATASVSVMTASATASAASSAPLLPAPADSADGRTVSAAALAGCVTNPAASCIPDSAASVMSL